VSDLLGRVDEPDLGTLTRQTRLKKQRSVDHERWAAGAGGFEDPPPLGLHSRMKECLKTLPFGGIPEGNGRHRGPVHTARIIKNAGSPPGLQLRSDFGHGVLLADEGVGIAHGAPCGRQHGRYLGFSASDASNEADDGCARCSSHGVEI
jgi:hypothetical protein